MRRDNARIVKMSARCLRLIGSGYIYLPMETNTKSTGKITKLSGYEAIEYAAEHGLTLSKYNDPIEGHRDGLTVSEAEDIAWEDPGLIYLELNS